MKLISATVFLLPLLVLPLTTDFVETPKAYFLIVALGFILVHWGAQSLRQSSGSIARPNPPILALVLTSQILLLLSLFGSQSRGSSLSSFSFWLYLVLFPFFLLAASLSRDFKSGLSRLIMVSAIFSALFSFFLYAKILPFFPSLTNSIGSEGDASLFFLITLIFAVSEAWRRPKKLLPFLAFILSLSGFILFNPIRAFLISGASTPLVLPWESSLTIFFSALRDFPLIGLGPGLYETAFSLYRPISLNLSQLAFLSFPRSTNLWLSLSVEYGLPAAAVLLTFFVLITVRTVRSLLSKSTIETDDLAAKVCFLILALSTFFFHPGPVILFYLFFLAALSASQKPVKARPCKGLALINSRPVKVLGLLAILSSTAIIAVNSLHFFAETLFGKSQSEMNHPETSLQFLETAVRVNPRRDLFRRRLSQNYLSLAVTLPDQKITKENQIMTEELIRSSLREAKTAIEINRLGSQNYRQAGLTYRALIGIVSEAGQTSRGLFLKAIELSPFDPRLLLDLAALERIEGNNDAALQRFNGALRLKMDYASAHYQMSSLLRQMGRDREAAEQLRITRNLIGDPSNPLYGKIEAEIKKLERRPE